MKSGNFGTFVFLVFFVGFGSVLEQFWSYVYEAFAIVVFFFPYLRSPYKGINRKYLKIVGVIWLCVFISSIMTDSSPLSYINFLIKPVITLLLITSFNNDWNIIKKYIEKALNFIAILAIINYFLVLTVPGLFSVQVAPTQYQVSTIGYIFNYFAFAERFGLSIPRNQGLYWEPGVLVILMNILIFIRLIENKKSIRDVLIPIIVVVTTFSTSGYIVLALIFGYWGVKRTNDSRRKLKTIIGCAIVIAAFTPLLIDEVKYKTTEGVSSTHKRQYDFVMGMVVATHYPIFGIGPSKEAYMGETNKYSVDIEGSAWSVERGNTNVFSRLFYAYGFPMAILFLFGLYRQSLFKNRLIFFLLIVFALFSEPLLLVYWYFLLLLSSGNSISKKNKLKYEIITSK